MKNYVETESLKQQLRMEAALGYVKTLEDVEKIIDFCGASAQPPADNWIPCSLATPKPFNDVAVTFDDGSVSCLHLEYDNKWHDGGWLVFDQSEVVAWMPLPEPYKGEHHEHD